MLTTRPPKPHYVRLLLPLIFIARLHPQIPHKLCMTTFSASFTNVTVLLPQSHDCSCCVSRQTPASAPLLLHIHIGLNANNFANFPTCAISLGLLMLPGPQSRDLFVLTLLYTPMIIMIIIRAPLLEIRLKCEGIFAIILTTHHEL
jgi:hypothetical protein